MQPRYSMKERGIADPPGFNAFMIYRHHFTSEGLSVCQVGNPAYAIHEDVDAALVSSESLLLQMRTELYNILNTVGMDADMGQLVVRV